ncbi:hypothetical protein C4573_04955 [Candidatus Woesearchaeota archaeon]|nr:MAG: hypothetical protein C4573_04955 [Candidatus Woesearchaeota archaeon]
MRTTILMLLSLLMVVGAITYAWAVPYGPESITAGASSQADINQTVKNVTAQAGNVTELNISANSITKSWQGFYGQISGRIVLANSNNQNFYDWNLTSPSGELYASPNSSINWTAIKCFNITGDTSIEINLTTMESQFGMSSSDADGIDETFNNTNSVNFTVGTTIIENTTCRSTYVYNGSGYQTTNFENVLLSDKQSIVFTTLLTNNKNGFNNNTYDYQMLVAEDGHGSAATTYTTYYFWIELS